MKNEILAKLRNILAKLYPDEASMRRISHDAGLDLARVSLNSSAINNWHLILIETEKLDCVDVLLTAVKQEYGSNQEFTDVCDTYHRSIVGISWTGLGAEFVNDLNKIIQHEQKNQERLEQEQKLGLPPDSKIQSRIDRLNQNIIEIEHFDWAKAEQAYLDKVIKLYDRVRILGSSVDVPLGNIFTQVYILDKPTARQRYDIEELRKQGKERLDFQNQPGKRIQGWSLVETERNLFILGKPGAGKTTFLKYIAIQAAHKQLPRIPLFVSLNQWADSKWGKGENTALLPFMAEQFAICGFPDASLFIDYILQKGQALVLFDGLDEVKQEQNQRRRLIHLLQNFAYKYDKSQHLITCRIAANDYAFAGFADVEVADFTPSQIQEYARNWFNSQAKKFDAFITELNKPDNKGLAELCNTPLLLSLLCLTFDNNMRFPPSRAELYEDALEALLRKWDSSRQIQRDEIYRELSYKRKLQLLMRIAVPNFEKGELFFRQRDLEKWIVNYLVTLPGSPSGDMIDGTAILKAVEAQHSILVERAQGIYSFSHLTFQEYLTARYLIENQGHEMANKLIDHLTDQRWREVFLLIANLLDDAESFLHTMHITASRLFTDSPELISLLAWAYERAIGANAPIKRRFSVQFAYIFLALSSAHSFNYTRDRGLIHDLAFTIALDHEFKYELDFTLALERSRNPASISNPTFTLELIRTTMPIVAFDYGLYYTWAYARISAHQQIERKDNNWQATMNQFQTLLQGISVLAENAGLITLAQRLRTLTIPSPSNSWKDWQQYATSLFVILRERNLEHKWKLSQKEVDTLNSYFYANELLIHCLNIAAVSDRDALLHRLLLPPESGQETIIEV